MEEEIKVETKKNRWKKIRAIALALVPIVIVIMKGRGKGKNDAHQ